MHKRGKREREKERKAVARGKREARRKKREEIACGALHEGGKSRMLHLTSGELHASAGRRIRGGGKGDIARTGEGGRERALAGVAMGKFGAFEIRRGREGGREREGVSCVCRIADALTVPRACVTSPLRTPRVPSETAPLLPTSHRE